MARLLGWLWVAATLVVGSALAVGFFGSFHPGFDSLGHFRLHLAAVLLLLALPLVAGRFWLLGGVALGFIAASWTSVFGSPFASGVASAYADLRPKPADIPVYKLLHLNLRFDNATPEKVLSLVGTVRPDVLTFNEISRMWADKLDLLRDAYPHRIVCEMANPAGGVAILSARPFAAGRSPECIDGGTVALAAIDLGGRPTDVMAVHLHWPWPFGQAQQLDRLEPFLARLHEPALLAGDLNASPWSAAARRVAQAGNLVPLAPTGPTWLHRRLPHQLRFAGLALDQVFAKGGAEVHSAATLEPVGSDHLPLLVEFSLPRQPSESSRERQTVLVPGAPVSGG